MARFAYIGEGRGTDAFGQLFPAGVAVEVTDEHVIAKLRGNQFFAESFDGVEVLPPRPEFKPEPKKRGPYKKGNK